MNAWVRSLAFVCKVCPLCIAARHFPDSGFAAGMKRIEKFCPFCNAYEKLSKEDLGDHTRHERNG